MINCASEEGIRLASSSNRMSSKMVALCSAAVGVIYAAGYAVTLPDSNPGSPPASQSQAPADSNTTYKDGTFTGTCENQVGAITVAVSIKNDVITEIQITKTTTHYRETLIDELPAQAVALQSADVEIISGATLSTQIFQGAVQQALAEARLSL